jgi:Fumarate reductase flavoprotein C-term
VAEACLTPSPAVLQEDAAVFRTQETLESGKQRIDKIVDSLDDIGVSNCGCFTSSHAPDC